MMIELTLAPEIEIEIDNQEYLGSWICGDTYVLRSTHITFNYKSKVVIDDAPYYIKTITILQGYLVLELTLA